MFSEVTLDDGRTWMFRDMMGRDCYITYEFAKDRHSVLGIGDNATGEEVILTQDQVAKLLPLLQLFESTGKIDIVGKENDK